MEETKSVRKPPQNIDAEKNVLGAMLIDPSAVPTVFSKLKSEDFYMKDHVEIFEAIGDLMEHAKPIDAITVCDRLNERGTLERCGGLPYVASLAEDVVTSANVNYYADIVAEKSTMRKLIRASGTIAEKAFDSATEVTEALALAEDQIFNISKSRNISGFVPVKDILPDVFQTLENVYKNKGQTAGIPSGFIDLDRTLSGLNKSNLILVAARPGMGKTSFMLNVAQHIAVKQKIPVAFFTLEMTKEELTTKILSSIAMVENSKIKSGEIGDDEWGRLAEALGELSSAPIYIDDTPNVTITDIRSKCKKLYLEKGIGAVFIDYLQIMESSGKVESRQNEISAISRSLKILAKELDVPVITGSQLNRNADTREGHRPMLADLRESGAIEQDADIVLLLFRDDYYTKEESQKKNIAEVIIAKNRHGENKTIELLWQPEYTSFRNLAK